MKTSAKTFGVLVAVTFLLSLTGTATHAGKIQQQLVAESTIEQVFKRGVLRVGMSTFKPWP